MVRTRFALILYFRMVAHKAACHTLSKAFLKSMKTWYRFCWCWRYFSHRILRLKICSVVLLPALNPACSSAIISSAWGFIIMVLKTLMCQLEGRMAIRKGSSLSLTHIPAIGLQHTFPPLKREKGAYYNIF